MNVEELRTYCLSKPNAEETFPFDEETPVYEQKALEHDNLRWFGFG